MYRLIMSSPEYGVEIFDYTTEAEAFAARARIEERTRRLNDGIVRTFTIAPLPHGIEGTLTRGEGRDAVSGIKTITGARVPCDGDDTTGLEPGLYLSLFHGRTTSTESMNGWGTAGPVIGPLKFAHSTYISEIRLEFLTVEDHDRYFLRQPAVWGMNDEVLEYRRDGVIGIVDGLVAYNGLFYGDYSVFIIRGETKAEKLLKSLVSDIRAMQHGAECGDPIYEMGYGPGETNDHQPADFFGPFTAYFDGQCMIEGLNGVSVGWPNLRILLEQADKLED